MSEPPITRLSLDLATHTGWMLRLPNGEKIHGSWRLPSNRGHGDRLLLLFQSLHSLLSKNDCMEHCVRTAIESSPFTKNPSSQVLGNKLAGTVELLLSTYGFVPPCYFSVSEWRSAFLKHDGFLPSAFPPKEIKASKERSGWLKDKVIEQCNRMGLSPENDNEADAIGIGWYFYNGGRSKQVARRAAIKDKKQMKKAQMSMGV